MPTPSPKRRRILRFVVWCFAVLLLLAVVAGACGAGWLYGWRLGDAGVSECRDPELQQVLRRMDERLRSAELKAGMRQMMEEELLRYQQIQRMLDKWNHPSRAELICRRLTDEVSLLLAPEFVLRSAAPSYRALIRRAAEEGHADVSNEEGCNLLWVALKFGMTEPVPYLLEHGCDPHQEYRTEALGGIAGGYTDTPFNAVFGFSPFVQGFPTEERITLLRRLCAHGADWNRLLYAELMWSSALQQENDPAECERLLRTGLELGYRPDLYAICGEQIFALVGEMPHAVEIAQELQRLGCLKSDLNAPMQGELTPLCHAIHFREMNPAVSKLNPAFIAWMLEQGADPNLAHVRSAADEEETDDAVITIVGIRSPLESLMTTLSCLEELSPEDKEKLTDILELLLQHGATPPSRDTISFDMLPPRAAELLNAACPQP